MKTVKQIHGTAIIRVEDPRNCYSLLLDQLRAEGLKTTMVTVGDEFVFIIYAHESEVLRNIIDARTDVSYVARSPNRRQLCRWMNEYLPLLSRSERGRVRRVIEAN